MQTRIKTVAIVLLLALFSVSTSYTQQSEDTVRIASAVYLGDVPTIVAEERGFFADQGIRAEVTHHASGELSMAKLRAGEADFALMALTPFVLDRLAHEDSGGPDAPVILASLVHSTDLLQIVTLNDSGIKQATDFRGRRIAVDRGTNSEFVWWLYEQFHGIERSSVELVDLSFADMPEALIAGRIDAAVLVEPRVSKLDTQLKKEPESRAVHFHVNNLYAGNWAIVTTRHTAKNRHTLCRKTLSAYLKAIEFADRKPNESIAVFNRRMDVPDGLLTEHWNALDYIVTLDWGLIADLQKQYLWARTVGYDSADAPLRMLDLIEPGPLRDVHPDAVRIPNPDPPNRAP